MKPDAYQVAAIANAEAWLGKQDSSAKLKSKVTNMLPTNYSPELDVSEELDEENASYFQ